MPFTLRVFLGVAVRELLGTDTGHGHMRVCASRRGRPPTFFNQLPVLPSHTAPECCELLRRIGLTYEALHADRGEDGRHGPIRTVLSHGLSGAAQDPTLTR
jgi:hypothetical protein